MIFYKTCKTLNLLIIIFLNRPGVKSTYCCHYIYNNFVSLTNINYTEIYNINKIVY